MSPIVGLVIVALMIATGVWIERRFPDRPAPRVVENVKPPESVNEFMGREPDTSVAGYAIWVKDGELYWCPFIRPATPADGQ